MSTAELDRMKLDLINWIQKLSDEGMIEILNGLKGSVSKVDWWDSLSETQRALIQHGLEDADKGNVMSSDRFWQSLRNG